MKEHKTGCHCLISTILLRVLSTIPITRSSPISLETALCLKTVRERGMLEMEAGEWLKKAVRNKKSPDPRMFLNSLTNKNPTISGWLPTPKLIKPIKLFTPLTTPLSISME